MILNVSPTKVTQAWRPCVEKIALAMLADPTKTLAAIHERMAEIERQRDAREYELRRAAASGQANRRDVLLTP